MMYFLINVQSRSQGFLKYGLETPDGKFNFRQLKIQLIPLIGHDFQIDSIDPINKAEYERLVKMGLSSFC